MTERDVFEGRLHAALVRHVANGPTEFDALAFARTVAGKEPRRHGFAATLTWRGLAVPRRAWALLLLAGLLAAMVTGTLLVGSLQERRLPAVVPPVGQVYECPPGSTPDKPGPVDQARPAELSTMAFDRRAGRLVALADAGPWTFDSSTNTWRHRGVETWTFDVCTNTWTQMHPIREPSTFAPFQLVYDVDSDATIGVAPLDGGISSGSVWAYDLQANTWTEKGVAPTDAPLWAYDPASGLVVAGSKYADSAELWNYDVETDTWTPIRQAEGPSYGVFAYDPSVERIVAYTGWRETSARPETWLLDISTGTWSRSGAETPNISGGWGQGGPDNAVYDEAAERTVVMGGGRWAAYDAAVDRWEVLLEADSGGRMTGPPAYDVVNRRLVGRDGGDVDQGAVAAFDVATREWTILLEPARGQATP